MTTNVTEEMSLLMKTKKEVIEAFGSIENFEAVLTAFYKMGCNPVPMLQHWKHDLNIRFAHNDPRVRSESDTLWVSKSSTTELVHCIFKRAPKHTAPVDKVSAAAAQLREMWKR